MNIYFSILLPFKFNLDYKGTDKHEETGDRLTAGGQGQTHTLIPWTVVYTNVL